MRGLDDAVDRLDSLSVALDDADLDDAPARVRTLADAIDEQTTLRVNKPSPHQKDSQTRCTIRLWLREGGRVPSALGRTMGRS